MLDGIVLIDPGRHLIVGYKDVRPDEFWVRGHMPGFPLLPGVLMCEAAAQLSCYYAVSQKVVRRRACCRPGRGRRGPVPPPGPARRAAGPGRQRDEGPPADDPVPR